MKIRTFATFFALLLLSLATPSLTSAQSASGTYQFSLEDGYTKSVEFDAQTDASGRTTGQITYSDEATVSYQDVDGTGDPSLRESYQGATIRADVDGMTVDRNQAVISGTIRESNISSLVGQRVLLMVEDNGSNNDDKLTWGVYKPSEINWTASDAELREDEGVGMRWTATDAEMRDDQGIAMPRDESITAKSFPVASYTFSDMAHGAGDIRVEP
ncbi:MAG TPA: hypothetical protein VGC66_08410 [Pyrinomonadaceae bacterium]|jgi:hypothetical protein